MSRSVRDLRDLICVSRMSLHEVEENETFSEDDGKIHQEVTMVSACSQHAASEPDCSICFIHNSRVISPDSGCIANESPGTCYSDALNSSGDISTDRDNFNRTSLSEESLGKQPPIGQPKVTKSAKKRRRKKGNVSLHSAGQEFSQSTPLPPVRKKDNGVNKMSISDITFIDESTRISEAEKSKKRINFDKILPYMDATIVSNWLTRSNAAVLELSKYITSGDNFVQFAHFWLSEFPDIQKIEILTMENDILQNEIALAFVVGKESRKVVRKDILELCEAVFQEFPTQLLAENGSHVFLEYLDILTAEKRERYKQVLSDVLCSTCNRQYAQWLLATRCFALVNVWSAVVNFYKNLVGKTHGMPILDLCSTKEIVPHERMLQAIRLGYVDVINYLITNRQVNPSFCDTHGRSLLFMAVMHNQTEAVGYFLTLDPIVREINKPAETGNTALHAAANNGNLTIVDLLCHCDGIDVNCMNPQCENATPLHLAVMHGHMKVVEYLMRRGADSQLNMGNTTAGDLARDFDHSDILVLLDQ